MGVPMNSEINSIGIYVRESRDDNEENFESIETQRDLLIDFIDKNDLGKLYKVYIDDNVSGTGFERNGLDELRKDVSDRNINILLIKDLSRLGRNNAKTLLFLDFMEEYGIRVITFDGRYDSAKDNDTVGIDTWYNERYVRDISRKIRANLRYKIQKGEYIGHAPFGYVKSKEEKNKLLVNESEAEVVREIYTMYREGLGYVCIANTLNMRGCPSPSSGKHCQGAAGHWNPVAVKRILSSRVYIGDTVQGVSEKISFKSKKTRRLPMEKWVVTPHTHQAIIDKEEFYAVQKIKQAKIKGTGTHKGKLHLLKGLIFCGECGRPMFARARKNRPIGYICSTYAKNGVQSCSSHFINERDILNILIGEIRTLLDDEAAKSRAADLLDCDFRNKCSNDSDIFKLEHQLEMKKRQQDILYMDRLEGKISEDLFQRMNINFEQAINQMNGQLERKKRGRRQGISGCKVLEQMSAWLGSNVLTNEIAALFIEKITVVENYELTPENENSENMSAESHVTKGTVFIDFKF